MSNTKSNGGLAYTREQRSALAIANEGAPDVD